MAFNLASAYVKLSSEYAGVTSLIENMVDQIRSLLQSIEPVGGVLPALAAGAGTAPIAGVGMTPADTPSGAERVASSAVATQQGNSASEKLPDVNETRPSPHPLPLSQRERGVTTMKAAGRVDHMPLGAGQAAPSFAGLSALAEKMQQEATQALLLGRQLEAQQVANGHLANIAANTRPRPAAPPVF